MISPVLYTNKDENLNSSDDEANFLNQTYNEFKSKKKYESGKIKRMLDSSYSRNSPKKSCGKNNNSNVAWVAVDQTMLNISNNFDILKDISALNSPKSPKLPETLYSMASPKSDIESIKPNTSAMTRKS